MRVVELCTLNRDDPEFTIILDWIERNADIPGTFIIGDNQADKLNGSLYFQFDKTEDAASFVAFLYATFDGLVLKGNVSKSKFERAFSKTNKNSPYYAELYSTAVSYGKMDGPSNRQIKIMQMVEEARSKRMI